MRRGRTLILLGILLALLAVLAGVLLARPTAQQPKAVEPTAQAVPMAKIVVAFQNISRGSQIITSAVGKATTIFAMGTA